MQIDQEKLGQVVHHDCHSLQGNLCLKLWLACLHNDHWLVKLKSVISISAEITPSSHVQVVLIIEWPFITQVEICIEKLSYNKIKNLKIGVTYRSVKWNALLGIGTY